MNLFKIAWHISIFTFIYLFTIITANAGEIYNLKNGLKFYVNVINQHSFFVDHEKLLIIQNHQQQVQQITLYGDPGTGSPAFLFKKNEDIILIDSNGYWYHFNQKGVLVEKIWKWQEDLPRDFIGIIAYSKDKNDYILIKNRRITKNDVYRYTDP